MNLTILLRLTLVAIWTIASCSTPSLAAENLSEQIPVPGGTAALARALQLATIPDRAMFLTQLTRVIYGAPLGASRPTEAMLQDLSHHLDVVDRFQETLAAIQPPNGSISLAMADQKDNRNRLKAFLDLVGLKLRERNKQFTVERNDTKQAVERLRVLAELGVNLEQLAAKLNHGDAVRVELPIETVPVPLTAGLWSKLVFQREVPGTLLFSSIIRDRRASLLCLGLAALDDDTLHFLVDRPQLLAHLHEQASGPFAMFAGSLRVRAGQLVVPGGAAAVPLWEVVVDEKVTRPDRFVRALFSKENGRLAYLYDGVSHLDEARERFALGASIKDATRRAERFRALAATVTSNDLLAFNARPFDRPAIDTILMLARVHVLPDGSPAAPAWQKFWSRAFDSTDLPENAAKQLKNFEENGIVDAAWLAGALHDANVRFRGERLDQLDFGRRVFASATAAPELADALVAVRAFPRYRTLMLTLERMGVRTPGVYVAAARQADRLSGLDADRGFVALSQFQGALALVSRMARVRTIDAARAQALVAALSAVPLGENGRFGGGIARWLRDQFMLTPETGDIDETLIAALAGPKPGGPSRLVTWEERQYSVDLAAAETRRLNAMREKLAAPAIATPMALVRIADALSSPDLTLERLPPLVAELKNVRGSLAPPLTKKKPVPAGLPPGLSALNDANETIGRTVQALSAINKPKDVKKALREAEPLHVIVDVLLADALLSLDYALDLGDPQGDVLLAGNVTRRHNYGFAEPLGDVRARAPWKLPSQASGAGVPWHVEGSALGLDWGLSSLALHRMTANKVGTVPVLPNVEIDAFTATVVLINPYDLHDADAEAIAAAVDRGRSAVNALEADGGSLDAIAEVLRMDGWRRRAVAWALSNDRPSVSSFFSLRELAQLGDPSGQTVLDHVGNAATALNGCLCTEMAPPGAWIAAQGRTTSGLLAVYAPDLNLRVLLVLHELHLPAVLLRDVLAVAMRDFLDEVRPIDTDDWLTLVRTAQKVSRERIEDYVATLTAGGPLVPVSTERDQ